MEDRRIPGSSRNAYGSQNDEPIVPSQRRPFRCPFGYNSGSRDENDEDGGNNTTRDDVATVRVRQSGIWRRPQPDPHSRVALSILDAFDDIKVTLVGRRLAHVR